MRSCFTSLKRNPTFNSKRRLGFCLYRTRSRFRPSKPGPTFNIDWEFGGNARYFRLCGIYLYVALPYIRRRNFATSIGSVQVFTPLKRNRQPDLNGNLARNPTTCVEREHLSAKFHSPDSQSGIYTLPPLPNAPMSELYNTAPNIQPMRGMRSENQDSTKAKYWLLRVRRCSIIPAEM